MTRSNVLVTCGGKWAGTICQLRRSMKLVPELSLGSIYVADREAATPAGHFADGSHVVPPIASPDYIHELLRVCNERHIRVIVPLIDVDLVRLTEYAGAFAAEGIAVVSSGRELTALCMDKLAFGQLLIRHGIPTPTVLSAADLHSDSFPVFVKPRSGFGSIGAGPIRSRHELADALAADPTLIVQELADGAEYTVDAFVNRHGQCTVRVPRLREKVVGGEAVRARTVRDPVILDVADRVIDVLARAGYRGPLNVQLMSGRRTWVIEVNARIASASVLANMATGGRYYAAVLAGATGGDGDGDKDEYLEDLRLYRFYGELYMSGSEIVESIPAGRGGHD